VPRPVRRELERRHRPAGAHDREPRSVLDLFGGSGSTLLACEQLKRKAFLVELSPIFCQLIINRYEKFTGNKAVQIN